MIEHEFDLREHYGVDPTELSPEDWKERMKAKLAILLTGLGGGSLLLYLSQLR